MDDRFRDLSIRLIESMGQEVDREYFIEDDVWSFVGELAVAQKPLSAATQQILLDLGGAMGLQPGASQESYRAALESQLGPSPHSDETIAAVVGFLRAQVNGAFEEGRPPSESPKLTGGGQVGPHQPLKNYDFGSD